MPAVEQEKKLTHPVSEKELNILESESSTRAIPRLVSRMALPTSKPELVQSFYTKVRVEVMKLAKEHAEELVGKEGGKNLSFSHAPLHSVNLSTETHKDGSFLLLTLSTGAEYDPARLSGDKAKTIARVMQTQHDLVRTRIGRLVYDVD